MIQASNMLPFVALCATVATNAPNAVIIDTKPTGNEFDFVDILLTLPTATSGGTSTATSLVFRESDSTSTFTTTVSTGGTDFTILAHNVETGPQIQRFQRDLRGKKRYIQVVSQAAAGYAVLGVHGYLSKGHVTPTTHTIVKL
jgi:hypothetical protein